MELEQLEEQVRVVPPDEDGEDPWPPDDGLHFAPNEFAYKGRRYDLSGLNYRLFETLAESPTKIQEENLAERVWRNEETPSKTILTALQRLRGKLREMGLPGLAGRLHSEGAVYHFDKKDL